MSLAELAGRQLHAPSRHDTALIFAFQKSDIGNVRTAHVEAISLSTQSAAQLQTIIIC